MGDIMADMADAPVLFHRDDTIGVITLNRPDNRNSMTPELLDEFAAVVARVRADHELRCVVITGRGSCFSAGADFRSQVQRQGTGRALQPHERSYAMYAPFLSVLDIEVPVIAALNGHAVGGGFGLALVCDVRIASRESRYGANFVRLGLHPGLGISYLLPRLVGVSRAAEMLLTGRLVQGDEAERIGLASSAVAGDQVLPRAMDLARDIAANAPIAVRTTKRSLYQGLDWRPREAALHEALVQAETLATDDVKEGIAALLEKREPRFRGQ
jgi:enoyl-CoA hydratase/carnithine racemase